MQHSKKERIIENFTTPTHPLQMLMYLLLILLSIYAILAYYFGYDKAIIILFSLTVFNYFIARFFFGSN